MVDVCSGNARTEPNSQGLRVYCEDSGQVVLNLPVYVMILFASLLSAVKIHSCRDDPRTVMLFICEL